MRPMSAASRGTKPRDASWSLSFVVALRVSCPAPRELRLARAVSWVSLPRVMDDMALPPSATSPRQFMNDIPTVLLLGLPGSSE